jgi:hypothetical protein
MEMSGHFQATRSGLDVLEERKSPALAWVRTQATPIHRLRYAVCTYLTRQSVYVNVTLGRVRVTTVAVEK